MSRSLSTTDLSAIAGDIVGVVEFMEIDLPTGNLYFTSGDKSYTWGGNTYSPVTASGTPAPIMGAYNETTDANPRPMQMTLSGVDQTLINDIVGNNIQWVPITWSIGFLDSSQNLLDNPSFSAAMFLGDCTISLGKNTGTITITCENLLADMKNRYSGMLQTQQDQQSRGASGNSTFSEDTFYQYAASLAYTWIYWGELGPSRIGIGQSQGESGNYNAHMGTGFGFGPTLGHQIQ